ncbi:MAG: DUF4390 domain-containing protein [Rhodocyclaceae bacterium]|nr:DUF4390 domain-containing protein [Rhodocyclaceae bacterium]
MMVSITPCWRKLLRPLLGLVASLCVGAVLAGSIEPEQAQLVPDEQGQALTARFKIQLGARLEEAVSRGVPLNFRLEFTLERKRKYWVDEHIAGRVLNYRLTYQALTRQYRLSINGLHQNFESLDEVLASLGRVARLHVVDKGQLRAGEIYLAAVRLSMDHEQLPKPLQVDALADRDWRVEARAYRWEFVAIDK